MSLGLVLSITALIRKESMGWKACENLLDVEMRLYVKYEGDARRSARVMPGHTHRQMDPIMM